MIWSDVRKHMFAKKRPTGPCGRCKAEENAQKDTQQSNIHNKDKQNRHKIKVIPYIGTTILILPLRTRSSTHKAPPEEL